MSCGILVTQPGIKPVPSALEVCALNHCTVREVPKVARFLGKMVLSQREGLDSSSLRTAPQGFLSHSCCVRAVSAVVLDLQPPGLQYARLPCPSPCPGVCSDSCPLSWWCYPIISSFAHPWLFTSGGQSIRTSATILPMNIQAWFPLGSTGLISCSLRDSQESSPAQLKSISSLALSLLYGPTLTSIHDCWKNHSFDYMDLCQQSDDSF